MNTDDLNCKECGEGLHQTAEGKWFCLNHYCLRYRNEIVLNKNKESK